MEFELPLTGLEKLEDAIGLPDFSGPITDDDYIANQTTHFQENFASQIVLRRLSVSFHTNLSNCQFYSVLRGAQTQILSPRPWTLTILSIWDQFLSTFHRPRVLQRIT